MPLPVMSRLFLAGFVALSAVTAPGLAQAGNHGDIRRFSTERVAISVETLATGLVNPWAVAELPDGAMIITERPGRLRILRDGVLSRPIAGLPQIEARGQGGLLDVAPSRAFSTDRLIFLTASQRYAGGLGTVVIRARLSADERFLQDPTVIFRMSPSGSGGNHFGSRIAIAADGTLYVSLGERNQRMRAQDYFDDAGSVIRINPDGSVPADNPFADGVKALPEIISKGHRNPQGITLDTDDKTVIVVEHGARGGDEINRIVAGRNYGWPLVAYGVNYDGSRISDARTKPGYESPLHVWDPSIAPGSIAAYDGAMFPQWKGDLLVPALKFQLLSRLTRAADGTITGEERMLTDEYGRMRDIAIARDGAILIVTDDEDGAVIRISRAE